MILDNFFCFPLVHVVVSGTIHSRADLVVCCSVFLQALVYSKYHYINSSFNNRG